MSHSATANADAPTTEATGEILVDAIVEASAIQQFVDVVGAVVDEAKIHFNEDGLWAKAVDPANVAMVDAQLDTGAFASYDSGRVTVGVNLVRLDERLGLANEGDLIRLEVDMETRTLTLSVRNIDQSIALIDPDTIRREPDIPDIEEELHAEAVLKGGDLDEAVTAVDMVTDHIQYRSSVDAGELQIIGEGDTDDTCLTYGAEELVDGHFDEDAESLFSLDYTKDMASPMPKEADVTIRHGTEMPIFVEYETCEGQLSVVNMIAPRINSE